MRFLVVDDHPLFRTALTVVVQQLDDDVEVVEKSDLDEMFETLATDGSFDLLILDLALGLVDSTESIPAIQAACPDVPVVVVSNYEDTARIVRTLELGARGYIPKSMPAEMIQGALRLVLAGGLYAPPNIVRTAVYGDQPSAARGADGVELSVRQEQVLRELSYGNSNRDISKSLDIPLGTIKLHIQGILAALNARNRTDAVMIAIRQGILSADQSDNAKLDGAKSAAPNRVTPNSAMTSGTDISKL